MKDPKRDVLKLADEWHIRTRPRKAWRQQIPNLSQPRLLSLDGVIPHIQDSSGFELLTGRREIATSRGAQCVHNGKTDVRRVNSVH